MKSKLLKIIVLFLLAAVMFAAPAFTQGKPTTPTTLPATEKDQPSAPVTLPATEKNKPSPPAPAADVPKPEPAPTPEFLADYDKYIAVGEVRANAEKKRAEYDATVKVLTEELNERSAKLRAEMARLAPGHQFDPKARSFVKPAPPKEAEKPKEKPEASKP